MAKLPRAKYDVTLYTNRWADGVLDTTTDPPSYTLKSGGEGIPVSHWHPSTDKVGWEIPLTPPGSSAASSITFFGGVFYAKQRPVIQRGKAKGFPPGVPDNPQDTWTAEDRGVGAEATEPAGA